MLNKTHLNNLFVYLSSFINIKRKNYNFDTCTQRARSHALFNLALTIPIPDLTPNPCVPPRVSIYVPCRLNVGFPMRLSSVKKSIPCVLPRAFAGVCALLYVSTFQCILQCVSDSFVHAFPVLSLYFTPSDSSWYIPPCAPTFRPYPKPNSGPQPLAHREV